MTTCTTMRIVLLAAAAVLMPVGFATESETDTPAGSQAQNPKDANALSRSLLRQGQYAVLDQRMNGFQQAYRDGMLDEFALLKDFGAFSVADPALASQFDAWVTAYPNSYAARAARGIYYFKSGVQTRGKRYVEHTTAAQLMGMRFYLAEARPDLQASLALDSKPMVSYNYLIRIGMELGEQDANRRLLEAALRLDPVALIARRPYLNSLETRWGGSLDEMLRFMQESRNAGLTDNQLALLEKLVDAERKWLDRRSAGQAEADAD